ncbi:MAG: calmodulin-binding protein [Thermogutta sp.]
MFRRFIVAAFVTVMLAAAAHQTAYAQQAYGRQWGRTYGTQDWNRFYHYPYVYYPQNYFGPDYYKSSEDLYFRYPPEMRIPVYNQRWQNYYPEPRRFYSGHHFIMDVF